MLAAPFATSGFVVLDVTRIVLALIGGVTAAYQVALIRQASTRGQQLRLAGAGLALAVLSFSRLENLGEAIAWQFVAGGAAILLLAAGSWLFRREIPAQPRRHPGPHGPSTRSGG